MIKHAFCDTCPGCQPCLMHPVTGETLPPEHPLMIKINRYWRDKTTYAERKAFIQFCMAGSPVEITGERDPDGMALALCVIDRIQALMNE